MTFGRIHCVELRPSTSRKKNCMELRHPLTSIDIFPSQHHRSMDPCLAKLRGGCGEGSSCLGPSDHQNSPLHLRASTYIYMYIHSTFIPFIQFTFIKTFKILRLVDCKGPEAHTGLPWEPQPHNSTTTARFSTKMVVLVKVTMILSVHASIASIATSF